MNWFTVTRISIVLAAAIATLSPNLVSAGSEANKTEKDAISDKYVLKEEPKGAMEVIATREKAKDKDDVTVVGRIGGRVNPWVKNAAAFSIVDASLKPCNEIPGDTCETPWDYCCEADLAKATLFVTILDEKTGKILKQDAREALKLRELQTVVVQGKARRDKNGNVSIAASKIFIRPEKDKAKDKEAPK
jgi:hypothetical protein